MISDVMRIAIANDVQKSFDIARRDGHFQEYDEMQKSVDDVLQTVDIDRLKREEIKNVPH